MGPTSTCALAAAAFRVPGLIFVLFISDYVHELLLRGLGPIYANRMSSLLVEHELVRPLISGMSSAATVELGELPLRLRAFGAPTRMSSPLEVELTPGKTIHVNVSLMVVTVVIVEIMTVRGPV